MEFTVVGREIYSGMKIHIWNKSVEDFLEEINIAKRFRLVLIKTGTGILNIDGHRTIFNAPAVLCLDEFEKVTLEKVKNLSARSLYFHPEAVNTKLNYENLRDAAPKLSQTEQNDRTCLSPFYHRRQNYRGYMEIGLMTSKKIEQIMIFTSRELNEQRDEFWPCRGRSFFLELILYLYRIYMEPRETEELVLNNDMTVTGVEDVLLYLHTNYSRKVTIEELTKVFNINRTSLNTQFKNTTNLPILAYLIKYRIKIASVLLRDTNLPIAEIIERVGFGDMTNFSRMFKKYMDCVPSDYRQQNSFLI